MQYSPERIPSIATIYYAHRHIRLYSCTGEYDTLQAVHNFSHRSVQTFLNAITHGYVLEVVGPKMILEPLESSIHKSFLSFL